MGIILEIIGIGITLMFGLAALKRAGIDIGWLNPFTFFHRMAWKKKVSVPPLYNLQHPVDVAAVLGMAVVKSTGEITSDQKQGLLNLYSKHLNANPSEANDLWIASSHLMRRSPVEASEISDILSRSAEKFSTFHIQTLFALMTEAKLLDKSTNSNQSALIEAAQTFFAKRNPDAKSWDAK
jgi:hypothetical protein